MWSAIELKHFTVSNRLKQCPPFLQKIIKKAIDNLSVRQVWIYGSRARNDHREKSDFDLSFLIPKIKQKNWTLFYIEVLEEADTLHALDLVNFLEISKKLQDRILKEGVLLYESKKRK